MNGDNLCCLTFKAPMLLLAAAREGCESTEHLIKGSNNKLVTKTTESVAYATKYMNASLLKKLNK